MAAFEETLRAINAMRDERIIEDYAIAGAMAVLFWAEPIPTYDLDVLVLLPPSSGPIVSLRTIYDWAARSGYPTEKEHVKIEGIPAQFLPTHNELADEAISSAVVKQYGATPSESLGRRPHRAFSRRLRKNSQAPRACRRASAIQRRGPGAIARHHESFQTVVLSTMTNSRPRPTPELLDRLRSGKRELHAEQRDLSLPEKVRQLLALQKIDYAIRSERGELRPWKRPWDIEP